MVDEEPIHLTNQVAVLGAIFAGGASRRYGSDKALAVLDGLPLMQWVIARTKPQVDKLVLSGVTRNDFPLPTIPDRLKDAGPLAALCSILAWAERENIPLVATFSCDAPFVPLVIVSKLRMALEGYDCAIASRVERVHPTFALWRTTAHGKIETAFDTGVRSLHDAIAYVNSTLVDFSALCDGPDSDPFFNINSRADMAVAQAWLQESRAHNDSL